MPEAYVSIHAQGAATTHQQPSQRCKQWRTVQKPLDHQPCLLGLGATTQYPGWKGLQGLVKEVGDASAPCQCVAKASVCVHSMGAHCAACAHPLRLCARLHGAAAANQPPPLLGPHWKVLLSVHGTLPAWAQSAAGRLVTGGGRATLLLQQLQGNQPGRAGAALHPSCNQGGTSQTARLMGTPEQGGGGH
jgi:hypothetical protein